MAKMGKSLVDLANEIERQQQSKKDFVVGTRALRMTDELGVAFGGEAYGVTDLAHRQIAEKVGIPAKYYDRMRENFPELLRDNVNAWWHKEPQPQMVRTLDGRVRAVLSDRYRRLDNYDVAETVLPVLQSLDLQIWSAEITERKLYIKAVHKNIQRDIPKGAHIGDGGHTIFDTLVPALCLSNSEVGYGALSAEVGTLTKGCTNLAWFSQRGMKRYHIGGKLADLGDDMQRLLSDDTKAATDKAILMQLGDVVKNAFEEEAFTTLVEDIKAGGERKIEGDPLAVVELVAKDYTMTQTTKTSVLRHLIEGGSLTQYGLANAVTRAAEDEASYDDATTYEKAGGEIMMLPAPAWERFAKAA